MTRSHRIPRISCLALALGFAACGTPALNVDGGGGSGGGGSGGGGSGGGGSGGLSAPDGGVDLGADVGAPEVPSVGPSCGDGKVGASSLWIGAEFGMYDGPAVVERSTAAELLLAFDAPNPAGTKPQDVLPRRAMIGGLGAKLLPVGAKVWLTKAIEKSSAPYPPPFTVPPSWTFSVRDKKGGRLLLGAASRTMTMAAIPVGNLRVTCETAFQDSCVRGTLRHSSFDVQGDTTVTVGDGETRLVRQGGVDYDVTVWAQQVMPATQVGSCSDYFPPSGFAVSFVARDLAGLVATLEVGPAPACGYGNVVAKEWATTLTQVSYETPYEGPVTFEKRETESQVCDHFGTVGLTGVSTELPKAVSCASAGLVPAPAAGQQLWLSRPSGNMSALRQSKDGPLVAASVFQVAPRESARIGDLLGTKVEVRERCVYGVQDDQKVVSLLEVAFGMTPPVVVRAGDHAVITIGAQQADVWLTATPEPFLTVAAR